MNRTLIKETPQLNPIPVKAPWFHLGVDFIGPLSPISKKGNQYILTLSDYFSKFVEAVPLPDKCAKSVSRILFKVILYKFIGNA